MLAAFEAVSLKELLIKLTLIYMIMLNLLLAALQTHFDVHSIVAT